jgi:hypothetical protein
METNVTIGSVIPSERLAAVGSVRVKLPSVTIAADALVITGTISRNAEDPRRSYNGWRVLSRRRRWLTLQKPVEVAAARSSAVYTPQTAWVSCRSRPGHRIRRNITVINQRQTGAEVTTV